MTREAWITYFFKIQCMKIPGILQILHNKWLYCWSFEKLQGKTTRQAHTTAWSRRGWDLTAAEYSTGRQDSGMSSRDCCSWPRVWGRLEEVLLIPLHMCSFIFCHQVVLWSWLLVMWLSEILQTSISTCVREKCSTFSTCHIRCRADFVSKSVSRRSHRS